MACVFYITIFLDKLNTKARRGETLRSRPPPLLGRHAVLPAPHECSSRSSQIPVAERQLHQRWRLLLFQKPRLVAAVATHTVGIAVAVTVLAWMAQAAHSKRLSENAACPAPAVSTHKTRRGSQRRCRHCHQEEIHLGRASRTLCVESWRRKLGKGKAPTCPLQASRTISRSSMICDLHCNIACENL